MFPNYLKEIWPLPKQEPLTTPVPKSGTINHTVTNVTSGHLGVSYTKCVVLGTPSSKRV